MKDLNLFQEGRAKGGSAYSGEGGGEQNKEMIQ